MFSVNLNHLNQIFSIVEVEEKASTKTEPVIQEVTPTKVIQDQGSSEKGSAEVSTAGATKGTTSEVPVVSTAEEDISTAGRTITYTRRSAEKRSGQDKGKAIMIESEPKKKEQIARDEEIARQWDKEERQRAMDEAKDSCPSKEKYDQILEESGELQD
ncbi:hypothetical protein Tco_0307604 [Tanacetum coccineum]